MSLLTSFGSCGPTYISGFTHIENPIGLRFSARLHRSQKRAAWEDGENSATLVTHSTGQP